MDESLAQFQEARETPGPEPTNTWTRFGCVVFVMGVTQGLGAAISRNRVGTDEIGAKSVLDENSDATTESLAREDLRAKDSCFDVSDNGYVYEAFKGIVRRRRQCDLLVNNSVTDIPVSVDCMTIEKWQMGLDTNIVGRFITTKAVTSHMRNLEFGSIVSTAAKRAWPNAGACRARKWGILGLRHTLSGCLQAPFRINQFPDPDGSRLQDPDTVAETMRFVPLQPPKSGIPEITALPIREIPWP